MDGSKFAGHFDRASGDFKGEIDHGWARAGATLTEEVVKSGDDWLELVDVWVATPERGTGHASPTARPLEVRTEKDFFGTDNPWYIAQSLPPAELRQRRVVIPPKTTITVAAGNVLLYRRIGR